VPTIKDLAICIRRWDFSETSQTVSLFTREHGLIRGLAKGAKRHKGSFSGGLDILARGQVVAIIKPGRDLATLTQWNLERSYSILRRSLDANRAGWYMADLVHHLMSGHDPHEPVYDSLVSALEDMSDGVPAGLALLRFQWVLLRETGYQPRLDVDVETGAPLSAAPTLAFSPSAGGIVADTGASDRWRVRAETIRLLHDIAGGCVGNAPPERSIDRANRLLAAYVREIIGLEPPAMRFAFGDLR
jgi:DNA repair protein RecO (recombination protein O)